MLYFAQLLGIPLRIATSSITTRALGPENYGILAFYGTIIGFTLLFFRFGFASSSKLLVAQAQDEQEEREIIGASIVIFLLIGLGYSLFIFGFSFFVDTFFHTTIGHILKLVAVLLMINPIGFLIDAVAKGSNKIGLLSAFGVAPRVLYLLGILLLLAFFHVDVMLLILLTIGIIIVVRLFVLRILKPSFGDLGQNIGRIWAKNREYGIYLYYAQIAGLSTYKLDGIFITRFANTVQLGFYNLAIVMTSPMTMLSRSLSVSLFKDFAHQERIPKKVIYLNLLWLTSCVIGIWLIGKPVIVILYSERFLPVARLLIPLAFAGLFQGAYQPYNMFLGANGRGKWLRNIAVIMSVVNVCGNIALVPRWGAMGAAIASIAGNLTYYLSSLFYYARHIEELKKQKLE